MILNAHREERREVWPAGKTAWGRPIQSIYKSDSGMSGMSDIK